MITVYTKSPSILCACAYVHVPEYPCVYVHILISIACIQILMRVTTLPPLGLVHVLLPLGLVHALLHLGLVHALLTPL